MRRIFLLAIILFSTLSIFLISINEELPESISIISLSKEYSRIITPEEVVSIPIYISDSNTFIIDNDLIESASLENSYNQLAIESIDIRSTNYVEEYDDIKYSLFFFDISFPPTLVTDYFMDFSSAYLNLIYLNQDNINIEIGNLYLRFSEITNNNHIDLFRMYSLTSINNDIEFISGIILGIENFTGEEIVINSIEFGTNKISSGLNEIKLLNDPPDYTENIDTVLGYQYDFYQTEIIDTSFVLNQDKLLLVPIKYSVNPFSINRFPLIISYDYLDMNYKYTIDDFQFFSSKLTIGENNGKLREFTYYY